MAATLGLCGKTDASKENGDVQSGSWSEIAIATLLDSYTAKFLELQRSNLRQKDWQDVLAKLSSTCGEGYNYARCRNKLDSLKKKFKNVKSKKAVNGRAATKWKWFDKMERLMERGPPAGQGIPGGIASGEKIGPLIEDTTDEDDATAAIAVGTGAYDEDVEEDDYDDNGDGDGDEDEEQANGFVGASDAHVPFHGFLSSVLRQKSATVFSPQNGHPLSSLAQRIGSSSLPKAPERTIKKKQHKGGVGVQQQNHRHLKEVASMMIAAMEKIEHSRIEFEQRRMELIKELDMKRNETNLQIAKLIIDANIAQNHFNSSFQQQQQEQQQQQQQTGEEDEDDVYKSK